MLEITFGLQESAHNMELADNGYELVTKFYENSVVFITGGTGFLGKVLVEKLLRAFLIKRIYLLVRIKNNLTVNERLVEFFEESVFDKLRKESPEVFKKVKGIEANFDANDLNISDENKRMIWNDVDIVFNVVASVKFNEKLRDAVEINVLGTKKILDLVMGIKHLKAFLHISTLYSNCNREYIAEKVYEPDIGYEKIIEITRILDDKTLEKVQHCLVGEMPNTYTMTKRCSENLVNHKAHCLPAGIFRPPIIISTYKEPVPGWTDNLYGPSGLCAGAARGLVHAIYGNPKKRANLVPADYCVNAMISVAWDVNRRYALRMNDQSEIPVYNYIYEKNNLTWGKYMELVRKGLHQPLDKALWYFSYKIIPSKPLYNIANVMCHTIPGYLLDLIAILTGQKRIYTKGYQKLCRVISMMSYFGLREWQFQNTNIDRLATLMKSSTNCNNNNNNDISYTNNNNNSLNAMNNNQNTTVNTSSNQNKQYAGKTDLEFDMNTIDWDAYFFNYLPGIKKYFFKEHLTDNGKCVAHYKRLQIMHVLLKSMVRLFLLILSGNVLWKYLLKHLIIN